MDLSQPVVQQHTDRKGRAGCCKSLSLHAMPVGDGGLWAPQMEWSGGDTGMKQVTHTDHAPPTAKSLPLREGGGGWRQLCSAALGAGLSPLGLLNETVMSLVARHQVGWP